MCLERCPDIFLLQLGSLYSAAFLEFSLFSDKAIGNADEFPFCDRLAFHCLIIDTLVQPRVEVFEGLVSIVGFPELPVVLGQVRCQNPRVVGV